MSTTSISVVLTHFNKGQLLQRTVDSLQPDLPELLEIIIVDDASTDPNWPLFSKKIELQYPKVKIIQRDKSKFKYGGHAYLRGETSEKITLESYAKEKFIETIKKVLKK